MEQLIPVRGALVDVVVPNAPPRKAVVLRGISGPSGIALTVNYLGGKEEDVVPLVSVESKLATGMEVLHVPLRSYDRSLGVGEVVSRRSIAECVQYLVAFHDCGRKLWLPWELLRFVQGARPRFRRADVGGPQAAERWRLRCLAHGLELWNENTGSLSRFDIDPLPHQIHLVHHILSSGNLNWLIADDVGLGKTIEAGLLLAALRQRKQLRRVLLVVPAGLSMQWKEDLFAKFRMGEFRIYGRDFSIQEPREWKKYDHVIVSLDRAKQDSHLQSLLSADEWDLVIFDEAHRLTRKQYGLIYKASERYRLAEELRSRTRNMVLLTATPHQGDSSQFQSLLTLLRPELREYIRNSGVDGSILGQMVFRNRKSAVTDMQGNLIFHGQDSRRIPVETSTELQRLQDELDGYLKRGYAAAERGNDRQSKAIGFVMSVYRKLAASSVHALLLALTRRLARLTSQQVVAAQFDADDWNESEYAEATAGVGSREEFFAGEIDGLKGLIEKCRSVHDHDAKLQAFMEQIIDPISKVNPDERVLIFTEYRGTQDYLERTLVARYGLDKVHLINGSLDLGDRMLAIERFKKQGQFLISTEAGGEGINLQENCHLLVNYDLPWNPMRLAQRIGRLYRYGQKKRVVAFNLQGLYSQDDRIVGRMYERLGQVAQDMAAVDGASSEELVADIMGELAGLMDVEAILENATRSTSERTEAEIEEALREAQRTAALQARMFEHAVSFDARALAEDLQMGPEHLRAFILGMLEIEGVQVVSSRKAPGRVWRVEGLDNAKLPRIAVGGRFTFERQLPAELGGAAVMDMDTPLVKELIRRARHYDFQGLTARIHLPAFAEVAAMMLRWQDIRGARQYQEMVLMSRRPDGTLSCNAEGVTQWLLTPAEEVRGEVDKDVSIAFVEGIQLEQHKRLRARMNHRLQPESVQWLGAAWSLTPADADASSHGGIVSSKDTSEAVPSNPRKGAGIGSLEPKV